MAQAHQQVRTPIPNAKTSVAHITQAILVLLRCCEDFPWSTGIQYKRPHLKKHSRQVKSRATPGPQYKGCLLAVEESRLADCVTESFNFILPLYVIFIQEAKASLFNDHSMISKYCNKLSDQASKHLNRKLWDLGSFIYYDIAQKHVFSLRETIRSLESFSQSSVVQLTDTNVHALNRLNGEMQYCLDRSLDMLRQLEAAETRALNLRGILAAQSQMQESQLVTRLTILAVIFIPLSFVTSIFGMNVQEFGTGDPRLSTVGICAVVVLAIAALLWINAASLRQASNKVDAVIEAGHVRWRVSKPRRALYETWYRVRGRMRRSKPWT